MRRTTALRPKTHLCLMLAAALATLTAATSASSADQGTFTKRGTVQYVVDGDTVDVRLSSGKRERIRLIGIDSPELSPSECLGFEAKQRARRLATGRRVTLVGDPTQDTRDRYGRLLAYVVLPGNRDLGRQLISEGFGSVYVYDRPFRRLSSYRTAQAAAKRGDRGVWGRCVPVQPPPPVVACAPSYPDVCIPPPPPDLDCGEITHKRFRVRWDVPAPDPHGFDGDRDGVGCET
jgi:micrococcal nuclease